MRPPAPANNSRKCCVVSFSDGRTLCSPHAASRRRAGRSRCPQAGSSLREGGQERTPPPETGLENPDSDLPTQSGRNGSVPGLRTARGGVELELPPVSKLAGQTGIAPQNFRSEQTVVILSALAEREGILGPPLGILGEVHWTPESSPSHLLGVFSGFQLGCCGQRMLRCGCLHHSQACRRLWGHGSPHPLSDRPHEKHSSMPLRPR